LFVASPLAFVDGPVPAIPEMSSPNLRRSLADVKKPAPPLYMPAWKGVLTEEDVQRIADYLWSMQPKQDKW
jgi:hypothetical protein